MFDDSWDIALRNSPFWLRFQLGPDCFSGIDQPVPRFLEALDRARMLADAIFGDDPIVAVLAASTRRQFAGLEALGFRGSQIQPEWRAPFSAGSTSEPNMIWRAVNVGDRSMRNALLWSVIASEMPIQPHGRASVFLTDLKQEVLFHPYDDRGADVRGSRIDLIAPLYRRFDSWLLDYDRPRMAAVFGRT